MRFNLLFIFLSLIILTSCDPARKASTTSLKKRSANYLVKKLNKHSFDADWLEGKAKINVGVQGQRIGASLVLRMKKDSVIWGQVKKLSFEVGRLKVTRDSIWFVDRFNKQYLAANIAQLERLTAVPISFELLQDLMFGKAYMPTLEDLESGIDETNYYLNSDQQVSQSKIFLDGLNFLVSGQQHYMKSDRVNINSTQGDYRDSEVGKFPYFRTYEINGNNPLSLEINFSKVSLNEAQTFPFSIPSHYDPLPL